MSIRSVLHWWCVIRPALRHERRRIDLMRRMARNKDDHREWKPLEGSLKDATTASLRASVRGMRLMGGEG